MSFGCNFLDLNLNRPYITLVEEIDDLTDLEKKLWIKGIWNHLYSLSIELTGLINSKKSPEGKNWNVYNSLFFLISPIPWLVEQFGKSLVSFSSTRPWSHRNLFRIITSQDDELSSKMIQSVKILHKYLLLLKHLYNFSDYPRDDPAFTRVKIRNDWYFQRNPQVIDTYVEIHEKIVAKMEAEDPSYYAYLNEL